MFFVQHWLTSCWLHPFVWWLSAYSASYLPQTVYKMLSSLINLLVKDLMTPAFLSSWLLLTPWLSLSLSLSMVFSPVTGLSGEEAPFSSDRSQEWESKLDGPTTERELFFCRKFYWRLCPAYWGDWKRRIISSKEAWEICETLSQFNNNANCNVKIYNTRIWEAEGST